MTTASSIRSAWEKLSAITCSALAESGLVVMLPSEVKADPMSVPMATTEAARISPQAITTRQGWTAETRARYWVIDVRFVSGSRSLRSVGRVGISLFLSSVRSVGVRALGGDPSRQDVVGVVGQVVADEGVEKVGVVVEVSSRQRDELSIPGRGGVLRCPGQEPRSRLTGLPAHQSGGDEQRGRVVRAGAVEDLAGGRGVATDQPEKQDLDVRGHALTVVVGADDPLTAT